MKNNKGFTLIELLVVMVVVLVVGTLVGAILFSTLRGASKTNVLSVVSQNGNYALSQMSKTIRNARQFNGVSTDGTNYTTSCALVDVPFPTPTPALIRYSMIKITSFDGVETTFSCDVSRGTITQNGEPILNSRVSVYGYDYCWFTCIMKNNSLFPTIGIWFILQHGPGGYYMTEKREILQFQTSVIMRNAAR